VVRGKPETFNRPDYNFRLAGNEGPNRQATKRCRSAPRQRGAPLDLIVAEAMILANSTWGNWLADTGRAWHLPQPGFSLAPGVKVRMGTKALPHARHWRQRAMPGAPRRCAATPIWSTSGKSLPARATARRAALAAPFKPKDAGPVLHHQQLRCRLQRLQRLPGRDGALLDAALRADDAASPSWSPRLFKENMVRADDPPLVLPVLGAQGLPRGAKLRVKLGEVDLITPGCAWHGAGALSNRAAGRCRPEDAGR